MAPSDIFQSVVKVTHESAPSTAEEKRKKSNIARCYLMDFDTKFAPELIKHVSEDLNPWQPTFNTDVIIAKIRHRIYPNVTETFEGKDPLTAPVRQCRCTFTPTIYEQYKQALNKVLNWRAAIGRRAITVAKTYFGDKTLFGTANEIEEQVRWLLPIQGANEGDETDEEVDEDADEEADEEVASIEKIVRQRKEKFIGAPFLWENGLIGPAGDEPVCKPLSTFSPTRSVDLTSVHPHSRRGIF